MEKLDKFFDRVRVAGLDEAFDRMTEMAEEELGSYLEDLLEEAVAAQNRPVCRIRYQSIEDSPDGKERYIFEIRQADEEEYGFMCSYDLQNDMIHFTALTQIRELMKQGYTIQFGGG